MHFEFKHDLSREAATQRVKKMLDDARPKMPKEASDLSEEWEDSTLRFGVTVQGQRITGELQITDTDYVIDAKLPLMMRLFEGRIERMIKEEAAKYLK